MHARREVHCSALAGSARSGQIRCQSSGRSSRLVTAPPVARSMARQCSIGTPRPRQFDTAWGDVQMASASFASPPTASDARLMMSSMPPMVHAVCSSVNGLLCAPFHAAPMNTDEDETWLRIKDAVSRMPNGENREVSWLADRLQTSIQRVNNWKKRGVPAASLVDIASALGWSINQVLGLAEAPSQWPFETIDIERFSRLTPRQAAMVEMAALNEIERIESSGKRQGMA